MILKRAAGERGLTQLHWLTSYHSFSFNEYLDNNWRHFSALRVINDDFVAPATGFAEHAHNDMEIVTYVITGELKHRDSLGHEYTIRPGEVQRMSAGTGIRHSEYNASHNENLHLLQIWFFPNRRNLQPSYQQKNFSQLRKMNQQTLLVSPTGEKDSLTISQDLRMYVADYALGQKISFPIVTNRQYWIQVVHGRIVLNNHVCLTGDGIGIVDEATLDIQTYEQTELLIFDLPKL